MKQLKLMERNSLPERTTSFHLFRVDLLVGLLRLELLNESGFYSSKKEIDF